MTPFEKFDAICRDSGLPAALDELADYLIEQERFHELFEVRKLQLREQLGLPIDRWQSIDDLPDEQGQKLESGLLDICREVGTRLMESGDVISGWQYMEPVGDKQAARQLLAQTPVTDENVEAIIQIAIGHGLDPELGFGLVLDRFGTCSSITTYESQLTGQPVEVRRGPARLLVQHVYEELRSRVRDAVAEHEQNEPDESVSLHDLSDGRDWLFEGLSHHIDTTHLASTVRIARILDDHPTLELAVELAEYGQKLHEDFHYAGELPFARIYDDTLAFFSALTGGDAGDGAGGEASEAVGRFEQQVADHPDNQDCAAWYVYLLDQLGRGEAATQAWLDLLHESEPDALLTTDVAPNLLTLVSRYGEFDMVKPTLLERGDLLGYATVVAIKQQRTQSSIENP